MIKAVVAVLFTLVFVFLILVATSGRELKRHKQYTACVVACMLLALVATHYLVVKTGGLLITALFCFHIVCALGFLALLLALIGHYHDDAHRKMHRTLAKHCIRLYAVTYITGMVILLRL